ncbi:SemiSWEET family sugar transporter [Geofilum sp. OHC36d9]|uniref:SemiSWEET family sugar transporter n=1 Tax=Geofilum sp. OHC36d9 TaxID=3458413 RepID=UPI00403499FA
MLVNTFGIMAAVMTTTAMFPQAYKIIKYRNVTSISLLMYVINTLGIVFWLIYGILLDNWILIITNIIGFVPACTIVVLKIVLGHKRRFE